jgi:tetratricopeptide (TPR) repeat protein
VVASRLEPSSALCKYFLGCEYASGGKTISGRLFNGTDAAAKQAALREFTAAIALDPRFAPAYAQRAELRFNQKQYALAIKDYDALIKLDPENAGALHDRGLAKKDLGNFWGAADDFSQAAKLKTEGATKAADDWSVTYTYQGLAECHAAMGRFADAANDMTEALRALLVERASAMSLPRLRDLFPECSGMGDDEFLHTVHDAFCPTMLYATFESLKHDSLLGQIESPVVPTAYVQRGDYFLRAGNLRGALADYSRARRAFPSSSEYTDRWRLAIENDTQAFYIDSEAEVASTDPRGQTIWYKVQGKKKGAVGWDIQRMSVDCNARTLQLESSTTYGADGTVIASHEGGAAPIAIVPDSIGEWFSKALCR